MTRPKLGTYFCANPYVVGNSTLAVVDVTNPASPTLLTTEPLPGFVTGVASSPAFLVIAANDGGLLVRDVP